jgi:hypothetical protein
MVLATSVKRDNEDGTLLFLWRRLDRRFDPCYCIFLSKARPRLLLRLLQVSSSDNPKPFIYDVLLCRIVYF